MEGPSEWVENLGNAPLGLLVFVFLGIEFGLVQATIPLPFQVPFRKPSVLATLYLFGERLLSTKMDMISYPFTAIRCLAGDTTARGHGFSQ